MSEINLDKKVVLKSLVDWDLYFQRIEGVGDIKIPKRGQARLTVAEIQSQVYAGNQMIAGVDGLGNHAKVFIDDKETRVLVGFEDEGSTEEKILITPERIKKILAYKSQKTFEDKVREEIILDSEKLALVEESKRQKLNDYEKIKFIEEYTGFKFKSNK